MLRCPLVLLPVLLLALTGCGAGDDGADPGDRPDGSDRSDGASAAEPSHPCDLLTQAEVDEVAGPGSRQMRTEPNGASTGVCAYFGVDEDDDGLGDVNVSLFGLGTGSLAPLVDTLPEQGLDVTEVEAAGFDEASRAVDPADPAHIDLYLASDTGSYRLTVVTGDEATSQQVADAALAAVAS